MGLYCFGTGKWTFRIFPHPVLHNCLLGLWLVLCLVAASFAEDEEQVFSSEETLTTAGIAHEPSSLSHPATAYWQVTVAMTLTAAASGTHVQMLLPLSDGRQSVLTRRTSTEGVGYREATDGLNLWGHWQVTGASEAKRQIMYEYTVQIADSRTELPALLFPLKAGTPEFTQYLLPSALIQSDAPHVREQTRHLTHGRNRADQVVQVLYEYIAAFPPPETGTNKSDALSVLKAKRGSRVGKTRALVALLRAAGIPARLVGGIRLGDTTKKRTTISWVEALVGDSWVPMDPAGGHFSWLPKTYLALYRNDLPLLIHTRQVPVEYTFFIRQTTRSAALASDLFRAPSQGKKRQGLRYESEHVHTVAAYVERPLASVVVVNDGAISQGIVDQILAEAQETQLNVTLLSTDFESSSSRETISSPW